ncbi:hypothetical protein QF030_000535 [Streptomyces rishiriensis]|uniref:Uncharacterized protein n=1 Tax=Streptomyces rishiriensis TaxID=68264 RepID=A0ABU0NGW3_STRRH|nr:hypothetical protein [Streptomyces rishiriensis]
MLPEDPVQEPQAPFVSGKGGWWVLDSDAVVLRLLPSATPVPHLSDAWAWQGYSGRLIGPDMRMRSRAPVGQADWEAQGAGSRPGARSQRLPS